MEIELHCLICGGTLTKGGDETECPRCGMGYSDILVSESIPFDESEPIEVSISIEGVFVKKKTEVALPFEMHSTVEESITV